MTHLSLELQTEAKPLLLDIARLRSDLCEKDRENFAKRYPTLTELERVLVELVDKGTKT